jgi:hypothetical protein
MEKDQEWHKMFKQLTEAQREYLRHFEWYWDGRRGGVKKLTEGDPIKRMKFNKDCDSRYNAKRRDITYNQIKRGEMPVEYIAPEDGKTETKYTLNDYTRPYIPPDVRFEVMESNWSFGKELFNAIDPYGLGDAEVGDRVVIQTHGHCFNNKTGKLIEKRKRQYYEQYECKVEMDNGKIVILREDEMSKIIANLVKGERNV